MLDVHRSPNVECTSNLLQLKQQEAFVPLFIQQAMNGLRDRHSPGLIHQTDDMSTLKEIVDNQ
jgi:hypothetical protein